MFDLSFAKIGVVLVVALVVLGPERLPHLLRHAGKWVGEFRKIKDSFESEVKGAIGDISDIKSNFVPGDENSSFPKFQNPLASIQESVSGIGDSLRSIMKPETYTSNSSTQPQIDSNSTNSQPEIDPVTNDSQPQIDSTSTNSQVPYDASSQNAINHVNSNEIIYDPNLN